MLTESAFPKMLFSVYFTFPKAFYPNSNNLSFGRVRRISFPPCNYLTDKLSAKSSKSFWPFFAISSKCCYGWLPKIAERCISGLLNNRGKVYFPFPFTRLRVLWLNFFSDLKKGLYLCLKTIMGHERLLVLQYPERFC